MIDGTDTSGPKYVAAKHYYRYIRPGAVRVELDLADDTTDRLLASAFIHDGNDTLTLVFTNNGDEDVELLMDLSDLAEEIDAAQLARFVSSQELRWARDDVFLNDEGQLRLLLSGQSITTLTTPNALIPEPAGLTLAASLGLLLTRRRRAGGAA